jgi:Carboxypeptidase regulatory-like domain
MGATKQKVRALVPLLVVFATTTPLLGQLPTGSIVGTVCDRTGAAVPGAQLVLKDTATGTSRGATTSASGEYEFLEVRPGSYDLAVEAEGFRRSVERDIVVNVGRVVHLDVTLEVGDVRETVEVRAETPLIEPDKTSISATVDVRAMQNLPLQDRQFLNLALTAPGTVPGAPGTRIGPTSLDTFTVAGMRSQSNNYTLDGISNNDPLIDGPLNLFRLSDAVQEFNVESSIAGAEAGRNSGAQVDIITKSGGNAYHGTLFYYHRSDAFDATPFFLNRAGQPKNPLVRNQFGGSVGGFIRRDKAFWFFSFEGFRQSVQDPATARVPTDAERASVTDPVSEKLLQFWPRANTPQLLATTGRNWAGTTPNETRDETYFWRIDYNLTKNHRLTARYAWFRGSTLAKLATPFVFNGSVTNKPGQHSFLLQETYAAASLVNEFRLGYTRNRALFEPADVAVNSATIFTDAAGNPLPGYIDTRADPLDGGLPQITITGFTNGGLGVGNVVPQGGASNTYELMDDISLIGPWGHSRHTLRLGVGARREIINRFLNGRYRGSISFPSWSAFASGQPERGSLRTGAGGTFRTWFRLPVYLYAQDSFKPRTNVTINYGLRWEYPGELSEKRDRGSNFVPGVGQMVLDSNLRIDVDPTQLGRAALLLTPVTTRLPSTGQFSVPRKNFAPFLGIAYAPKFWRGLFGDGKTVIRTGFRLSYDDVYAIVPTAMGLNFPPVLLTTLPTGSYTWATVLSQNQRLFSPDPTVVPQGERGIVAFAAWDVNPPSPYAMNYALEIERQLGRDFAIGVSYTGTQGRKLGAIVDPNQPTVTVNDPAKRGDQAPNVRTFPFLQYSNISQAAFGSNSNFNGMLLVVRKRASHGLSFTASYELSKSLDDNSSFFATDGTTGAYADTRNRKLDYGLSSFDVRHRVIASWVYELPLGPNRAMLGRAHGFLGQVVGGWTLSGITSYRSGFPFTIFASSTTDFSGLNQFSDRVNLRPGVSHVPTNMSDPDHAFDPAVFAFPGAGSVGNVGRNTLIGPHFINQDFAVLKSFRVRENEQVEFRAEFFNLFNHANFKLPENHLDQSGVGTIGDTYDPRLIQFGLRFQW